MNNVYFDYNATTPVAESVFSAMSPFYRGSFANPSSLHTQGKLVSKALRNARKQVASLFSCEPQEIIFTSGGTESNNAALRSVLHQNPDMREIITSSVEHSSINKLCQQLEKEGYKIHWVGVDSSGSLNVDELYEKVSDNTAAVTLMSSNNETGVLFPVEEMGEELAKRNIYFHVDAVQSVGKKPLDCSNLRISSMAASGHKFYGPKGIGILYINKKSSFHSLVFGGAQERGRRAGTENVPGIIGIGAAAELCKAEMESDMRRIHLLRDAFEEMLKKEIEDVFINGVNSQRLPNASNVGFSGIEGEALLFALDQRSICASSGSACLSGANEPSHVLKAMGLSDEDANASLRFSFGKYTTESEIDKAIPVIKEIVTNLRKLSLDEQHTH